MGDLARHRGKRNNLVKLLIEKGIRDREVLKAIGKVPRHLFIDSSFEEFAYQDKAFPIAAGQTISQPYTVAFQSEKLALSPGQKVLEVGTGSGYQAAVLCEMGMKVFSIERQKELFNATRPLLQKLGYTLYTKYGDGYAGLPNHAPFDGIIVTAGAPEIPKALLHQLKVGGRLVIPVGTNVQKMKVLIRKTEKDFELQDHGDFRFVPMLHDKNH
ncbi:protein-L-isoaspartate(D-aspartate) O-methyltransferase [Croceimicrobium sp.]|uniref:protein-L-isoaspartate(D-aspartate) O-methyltransferase n=1 Tax=Croceimicrobium sp. TaxID=2828340 RepID=UPI003BAA8417